MLVLARLFQHESDLSYEGSLAAVSIAEGLIMTSVAFPTARSRAVDTVIAYTSHYEYRGTVALAFLLATLGWLAVPTE
jgi:hypothetical protein